MVFRGLSGHFRIFLDFSRGTTRCQRGTQRQFDAFCISVPLLRATKAQAIVCKQYRPNPPIRETAETSHFSCTRQFAPSEPCGTELQKAGFTRCVPHDALRVAFRTAIHTAHCTSHPMAIRIGRPQTAQSLHEDARTMTNVACDSHGRRAMADAPQLSHATFTRQHNLSRTHLHTTALAAYSANPPRRKAMNASAAGVCMMLRFHATTDLASRCGASGRNRNPSPTCPTS